MSKSLTGHVGTNRNPADLATKVMYGKKCQDVVSRVLSNIYDDEGDDK